MSADTADLLGLQELRAMLGVSRRMVHNYRLHYDLPEPIRYISGRPVWLRSEIEEWYVDFLVKHPMPAALATYWGRNQDYDQD